LSYPTALVAQMMSKGNERKEIPPHHRKSPVRSRQQLLLSSISHRVIKISNSWNALIKTAIVAIKDIVNPDRNHLTEEAADPVVGDDLVVEGDVDCLPSLNYNHPGIYLHDLLFYQSHNLSFG